jgi:hypothetical protein
MKNTVSMPCCVSNSVWNLLFDDEHEEYCCCSKTLKVAQKTWTAIGCCCLFFCSCYCFIGNGQSEHFVLPPLYAVVLINEVPNYNNATRSFNYPKQFILISNNYFIWSSILQKNHILFISIPKFMPIFASCAVWCLLFCHDFCCHASWPPIDPKFCMIPLLYV